MKLLVDYTNEELVELTPQEIKELAKLEAASRGLSMEVKEPVKPEALRSVEPDLLLSEFNSFTCDRATGDKIMALVLKGQVFYKDYNKSYYRELLSVDDYSYPKATFRTACSQVALLKAKISGKELQMAHNMYDEEINAYNTWVEETSGLIEEIDTKVLEARREIRTKELAMSDYKEYLKLAKGDKEIAESFYRKRYGEDAEIPEVL